MAPQLSLAGAHEVDRVWPAVAQGIEDSCRRTGGDLTGDYLWSECRAGRAFLVVIALHSEIIGASVWRFEKWTSGRKLRCLALYGRDIKSWLGEHQKFTENMARTGDATAIVTEGRVGWGRLFPKARVLRQLYEMELT